MSDARCLRGWEEKHHVWHSNLNPPPSHHSEKRGETDVKSRGRGSPSSSILGSEYEDKTIVSALCSHFKLPPWSQIHNSRNFWTVGETVYSITSPASRVEASVGCHPCPLHPQLYLGWGMLILRSTSQASLSVHHTWSQIKDITCQLEPRHHTH